MKEVNGIDDTEKVLGGCQKTQDAGSGKEKGERKNCDGQPALSGPGRTADGDPLRTIADGYPDRAVEFCLVENAPFAEGCDAHRRALARACRALFFDGEEPRWRYDCDDAEGERVAADVLFAVPKDRRGENYRGAFLYPPHGGAYSDQDFDRVNAVLFPHGTDRLEVYEWTTDWSEYFDEGREWWGALCYTVYDRSLDRFIVIMASATD